ncbi:carboxylesterase/lipase family protein [Actinocrispum wychmicini]|uniref:Carboxylic ester hydrolase n=1 Tax=Actinocrispum wychmicini TaxID=1213861 RepID=A0A4R2K667_9PSEU|nr:carboxylesterase family protein [Actinocrispum wychmicini]TCO65396.1 para-nitrobenzyl esterase [Actinocrispum wychmicini]
MTWKTSVLTAIGLMGLMASPANAEPANLVYTDHGPVRGVVSQNEDVRSFQGIPFAAPPVGQLRWRPPQPAARWHDPLDASRPRSQCAQLAGLGTSESVDEDCLYLNVTTPAKQRKPLPVMVWVHGGGFTSGNGSMYDATKLVTQGDVIVVTVNYRLGPLGFLATPGLSAETPGVQSGDYGLEDQQAALRWVQRNAAAFGGDARNVTVFGESAGAAGVCMQLTSPTAAGLFQRAIGQSFSCTTRFPTKQEGEALGTQVATQLGCADVACLRAKPVKDLLTASPAAAPVIGGREFPLEPADALRQDRFSHVPVLWGSNLDEMRLFVGLRHDLIGKPVTAAEYEAYVRATYGPDAGRVLALYPVTKFESPSIALAAVQTDGGDPSVGGGLSTCPALRSYGLFTAPPRSIPLFTYQFVDRTAPAIASTPTFPGGAQHAAELNFLWGHLFGPPLTPQQEALSSTMVRYWTTFAHTGNPNGPGTPPWHHFRSTRNVQALGLDTVAPSDPAGPSNCAFWATVKPNAA